jgi:hypothetical protein
MGPGTADGRRPSSPLGGGGPRDRAIAQARQLIAEMEAYNQPPCADALTVNEWAGRATWVLKELTRDA